MLTRSAAASDDSSSGASVGGSIFGILFFIGFIAAIIAGGVWFFNGPAKHANDYMLALAAQISDPHDRALFYQIYQAKQPKNVVVAWFLSALLSPTIAYVYLGKWGLAVIAFFTLQGFGFWWLLGLFIMPSQAAAINKLLADQAFNEIRLARPVTGYRQQPVPNAP